MEKQNSKPLIEKEQEKTAFSYKGFMSSDVKQAVKEAYEEITFGEPQFNIVSKERVRKIFEDKFGFELE